MLQCLFKYTYGFSEQLRILQLAHCRERMLFFPPASSVLRSRDYNSLAGELKHADGCSHVMPDFTLVSNIRGWLKTFLPILFGLMVNFFRCL